MIDGRRRIRLHALCVYIQLPPVRCLQTESGGAQRLCIYIERRHAAGQLGFLVGLGVIVGLLSNA
jgi:hypothetical protein